jgi:hypothetical protein
MKLRTTMNLFLVAIALAVAANGQATSTCQTQGETVRVFNIERQVPLQGILTIFTVNAPPNIIAGLVNGTLQIREKMIYHPKESYINGRVFVVPPATPFPTPPDDVASAYVVQTAKLQIAQIFLACQPFPTVAFIGTVVGSTPNPGGYGVSLTGATVAISVGYTSDSPPKLFNSVVSLAGIAVAWAPSAIGELVIR